MQTSANQTRQEDSGKSDFPGWPVTDTLPPNPTIIVRFGGLMGFCYRSSGGSSGAAEIGFNPGDGKHRIAVEIWEDETTQIYPTGSLPTIHTMRFGIESKPAGVNFLKLGPDPFDRQDGDPNDFRWMLDLEGENFYHEKPDRDASFRFRAKLLLMHGTVHTLRTTRSTFNRVSVLGGLGGIAPFPLYHVSREMGAAIQLAETDFAFLEINNVVVIRLPITRGKKYEVRFSNGCQEANGDACEWYPTSIVESRRNDFQFHRHVFSLRFLRERFGLRLVEPGFQDAAADVQAWEKRLGTDRAPCMAVGYGQTDGFS